jgi:hypothetical protein
MNGQDPGNERAGIRELVVSFGWCGGMGEAVLAPPHYSSIQFVEGLPVFMTDGRIREYVLGLISPAEFAPAPVRLRITGEFRLAKKTGQNDSIPGSPSETYWDAEILHLDSIGIREESQESSGGRDLP